MGDQKWSVTGSVAKYVDGDREHIADASSAGGNSDTYQFAYQGPDINQRSDRAADRARRDAHHAGVRLVQRQRRHDACRSSAADDRPGVDTADSRVARRRRNVVGVRGRRQPADSASARSAARRLHLPRLPRLLRAAHRHDRPAASPTRDRRACRRSRTQLRPDAHREHDVLEATVSGADARRAVSRSRPHRRRRQLHAVRTLGQRRRRERRMPVRRRRDVLQYPEYKQASWNYPEGDLADRPAAPRAPLGQLRRAAR